MAYLVAREGRHRQRYHGNHRLVSGCIPYRVKKGSEIHDENCMEDCIEVLMISSPDRHDLVFPKGGWDDDETVYEAACREALEEAGVRGVLNEKELGEWEFRSKSKQYSLEGGCRGYMFALEVTEELDTWPEQETHGRKWLSISEAFILCRYEWLREALRAFLKLMGKQKLKIMTNQQEVMDSSATSALTIVTDYHVVNPKLKIMTNQQEVMDSSATSALTIVTDYHVVNPTSTSCAGLPCC